MSSRDSSTHLLRMLLRQLWAQPHSHAGAALRAESRELKALLDRRTELAAALQRPKSARDRTDAARAADEKLAVELKSIDRQVLLKTREALQALEQGLSEPEGAPSSGS